jgi:hypothetical protein
MLGWDCDDFITFQQAYEGIMPDMNTAGVLDKQTLHGHLDKIEPPGGHP